MKSLDVRRKILADNEAAAGRLRERFRDAATLVVNLISSPGSGKTSLLEASVPRLQSELKVGVMVGDVATDRDAQRLSKLDIPSLQLITGGSCHLDARLVDIHLEVEPRLQDLDVLFIENVGNLICPTSYDLGEDYKVALLSVTEGSDKPLKYPGIFSRSTATVLSKIDLLEYTNFDLEIVRQEIRMLNPNCRIFETSAKTGQGIESWCEWLQSCLAQKRTPS